MISKMHFYLINLLVLLSSIVSAQDNLHIKGKILESGSNTPIEHASIAIIKDGSTIDGCISEENGKFRLQTLSDFHELKVSFIGFEPKVIPRSAIESKDLLEIFLSPAEELLNEILVETERTVTQQLIDRRIINVGADLQQTGATALEVFDQLAEIQTDLSSGEISLRGSNNILLLVNGKPSGMSPSELLAQIPSSSIDKIEIITSPSAKYQANGISGILNIQLKKRIEQGLNLKLNAGVGTKRHNYGLDGNYNFKQVNFRWNYMQSKRRMYSKQWIERSYKTGTVENIYAPQDFDGSVQKASFGFDFLPNKKNEFSVSWDYVDDAHDFFNKILYSYPTGEDSIDYLRTTSHSHLTNTWNVNYRYKINEKEHFLELDYNLNKNDNDFPLSDFENNVLLFEEHYINQNTLQRLSLDYTLPISKHLKLEAGSNWNKRNLQSQYHFTESNHIDQNHSLFDYEEDVLAFYSSFRWQKEKKYSLQAGLRYEYFNSSGGREDEHTKVSFSFADIFPSLHLNYEIDEYQKLNLGLSRRISRPHFNHINPFRLGNPYFTFVGNPGLSPEYSNNIELSYNLLNDKVSLAATTFYRYRKDVIQRIDSFTQEGIQRIKNINAGNNTSFGIETTIGKDIVPFWRASVAANYYFTKIHHTELVFWDRLYTSSIQVKNTFKTGKKWTMDLSYRHTPKRQRAFQYLNPRNRVDFAVRAKLLQKRLSLNLTIIDVFDINLFYRTTKTDFITQNTTWKFQSQTRGFLFNVSYQIIKDSNFSRSRKKRDYSHGGAIE